MSQFLAELSLSAGPARPGATQTAIACAWFSPWPGAVRDVGEARTGAKAGHQMGVVVAVRFVILLVRVEVAHRVAAGTVRFWRVWRPGPSSWSR